MGFPANIKQSQEEAIIIWIAVALVLQDFDFAANAFNSNIEDIKVA